MRLMSALLLGCALALPAAAVQAQDAPPNVGPYIIMDASTDNLVLAASGTRNRSGAQASITVSVIAAAATREAGIARLDMAYLFDCTNSRFKTPAAAAYDLSGGFMGAIDDDGDWEAVNPEAPSAAIQRLACDNTVDEGIEPLEDLNAISAVYQEWVLTQ